MANLTQFNLNPTLRDVSVQLLINLIVRTSFHEAKCLIQLDYHSGYKRLLPTFTRPNITNVINPLSCIPGCYHYIIHDPLTTQWYEFANECYRTYYQSKFKAIVVMTADRLYNKGHYAKESIIIKQNGVNLQITCIDAFVSNPPIVLNTWSINENKLLEVNNNIEEFFNENKLLSGRFILQDKQAKCAILHLPNYVKQGEQEAGISYKILKEVTSRLNITWRRSNVEEIFWGIPVSGPLSYPVTWLGLSFYVPKPTLYINIFQTINVFPTRLWFLIYTAYVLAALYFRIRFLLISKQHCPSILQIVGVMYLQGITPIHMPNSGRLRIVLGLILLLTTIYSALFGSGIVKTMISTSYKNDIKTMDDLAKSPLPIYGPFNPLTEWSAETMSSKETTIFSRFKGDANKVLENGTIIEDMSEIILMDTISTLKLSTMLTTVYTPNRHKIKSMHTVYQVAPLYLGLDAKFVYLIPKMNEYILYSREAGLDTKWEWEEYMLSHSTVEIWSFLDSKLPPNPVQPLRMKHIFSLLIVLALNLFQSILTFICEVISMLIYYVLIFT